MLFPTSRAPGAGALKVVQGLTTVNSSSALKKISGEIPAMRGIDGDVRSDAVAGGFMSVNDVKMQDHLPEIVMEQFSEHGDAIASIFRQMQAIEATVNEFMGLA